MPSRDRKALLASAAIVGAAVLACAAVVGRYRQQKTELEQFLLVPMNGPMLFSHPGGMPGNGYSGRANNLEDYTDPYGGGDVPGPYGYANDPYDGDWALGPLGGKGIKTQNLYFTNSAPRVGSYAPRAAPQQRSVYHGRVNPKEEENIWGAEPMGTNSLFMPRLTATDVQKGQEAHAAMVKAQQARMPAAPPTPDWVGTNTAFLGAHQGGDSSFTHQPAQVKNRASNFKKAQKKAGRKMKVAQGTMLTSEHRAADPNAAEYGVDGEPSNLDHAWVHVEEPFSFACDETILGCANGLTVDDDYANDLKGVDYQ